MALQQEQLKLFAKFIENELGIIYSDSNYFQLEHRLEDIAVQLGLPNTEELWQTARKGIDGNFKTLLLDLATNNETSFFRDSGVFKGLEHLLVPELMLRYPTIGQLKIWSAACSSGQEPYSIALTLHQAKNINNSFPDYNIVATDFSDRILERARSRTYSQLEVQRGISAKNLITFFDKGQEPNTWVLKETISPQKFKFSKLNLLSDWNFPETFHIIFCRNILIYQSIENKIKVIENLRKSLVVGGFLVLGAAESMLGISNLFKQVNYENAIFYQKI